MSCRSTSAGKHAGPAPGLATSPPSAAAPAHNGQQQQQSAPSFFQDDVVERRRHRSSRGISKGSQAGSTAADGLARHGQTDALRAATLDPPLAFTAAEEGSPARRGGDGAVRGGASQSGHGLGVHPLFSSYDAVGVEGAEAAAVARARSGESGASPASRLQTWTEEEQLLGMQLPLSSVLSCLAREQRQVFNWRELVYFAPFFVVFLLFVLVDNAPHTHIHLNAEALRKATDFDAKWMSNLEEQLLLEVFRVDTEGASANSSGDFVPGTSKYYPWLFSYYNETVNAWTRQDGTVIVGGRAEAAADEEAPVDAQVERVAGEHHNTNMMRFSSLRTKRDLMRWLLGPFLENLWDCANPDYATPWYEFRRGSQRMVGAVRLTATRAPTDNALARRTSALLANSSAPATSGGGGTNSSSGSSSSEGSGTLRTIPGWCRRRSLRRLRNLPCGDREVAAGPEVDESTPSSASPSSPRLSAQTSAAASPATTITTTASTPSTIDICANTTNPALSASQPLIRLVDGDNATGAATYEMNLPFPATCHDIRTALRRLATPIRAENETVSMEGLWSRYILTTGEADDTCAAFFFHPRTTEMRLRYVVYGAAVNQYFFVDMRFRFAGAGSVVVPELRVRTAPALSWSYNFTSLALSITLGVVLLLYAHHTVTAYLAVFARKRLRWERRGWGRVAGVAQRRRLGGQGRIGGRGRSGSVTGLMVALQDLLRLRSLAHLCTLGLTAAGLVVYWWAWGETSAQQGSVRPLSYTQRLAYPESLQYLCEHTAPLYTRLFAAATFFLLVCAVRFACGLFSGMGLVVECLVDAMGRLFPLVFVYLWFTIASAVMGMCLYGATSSERFSDFRNAFLSLLVMFIDRGKGFWADERARSGFDSMLPAVYGGLQQREGRPAGHAQSYRWSQMLSAAGQQAHSFWLFFIIYATGFLFFVLVAAVVAETFHRTLGSGPNGNKEGLGLEHHQRRTELAVGHARRCLGSWSYIKETAARFLWSRARVTVLADVREQLQLAAALHSDITYVGLLWLLPRALQAEVGPQQLRLWWLAWAQELQAQQRARRTWERRQWLKHWDRQPTGLRGWLRRVVPDNATLENRAMRLNAFLEELPAKVARHAEGIARR